MYGCTHRLMESTQPEEEIEGASQQRERSQHLSASPPAVGGTSWERSPTSSLSPQKSRPAIAEPPEERPCPRGGDQVHMPPKPMSGEGSRQLKYMFKPRQVPERTAADDADKSAAAAATHAPTAAVLRTSQQQSRARTSPPVAPRPAEC